MESLSKPTNTVWSFPFTPQDWEQTPLVVQAYVCTLHDQVEQLQDRVEMLERTSRTHSHKPLNLLTISFIEHIDLKNN